MSMGGGVGVTASLYTAGKLSGPDVTVLMPAIFLMGALLQFMGAASERLGGLTHGIIP